MIRQPYACWQLGQACPLPVMCPSGPLVLLDAGLGPEVADAISFGESAVTDEGAGDAGEGEEVLGFAFVASVEAAAAGKPGRGAFDGPAVPAQSLGGRPRRRLRHHALEQLRRYTQGIFLARRASIVNSLGWHRLYARSGLCTQGMRGLND